MRLVTQLSNRVRSLVMQPAAESKRTYRYMRYWVIFTWFCARKLKRDNATQMAAALTYRTMFSLLPMLVLALVVLQAFSGLGQYQTQFKQSVISFLLPQELLQRDTATGELVEWVGPPIQAQENDDPFMTVVPSETTDIVPADDLRQDDESVAQARALLGDNIEQLLNSLENVDFGKIGWAGLLVFIYGATTLLETAEKSFNAIFDVEQGRPWYLRLTYYYTMVTLGPILIITGQVIQQRLMNVIEEGAWTNWLAGPSLVLAPIVTTWLVFLVMFLLLPLAKVQIRAAWLGSFVAAIFWVGSKELFAIYATRTGATSLYGALALVPLFLLWVYLTWLIVLFGLEVTFTLQAMKSHQFQREVIQTRQHNIVQSTTLLNMLWLIGDAFDKGQSIRCEQLTETLGLTARMTRVMIQELEKANWIHSVRGHEDGLVGYSLAQPPQAIRVSQVLVLANQMGDTVEDPKKSNSPAGDYLQKLIDVQVQQAGDNSLADVLKIASKPVVKVED
ncbi:MAG: YihY family inner membrane protein [Phycisphaeraceae bacterium]|nr:YihY family inner membrane protein [Phycisphaeraceae bacterium]